MSVEENTFDEEDDGACIQCGAEAPLNGAELCEECHDEEQRELEKAWAESLPDKKAS